MSSISIILIKVVLKMSKHNRFFAEATWSCLLKGAKYCHLKLLRECSDVFGGFQCTKCLNGSIPDTQDDKKCKGKTFISI